MMDQNFEYSGSLGKNDYKEKESQPDYTGKVYVKKQDLEFDQNGVAEVKLSAWIRNNKKTNQQFLSVSHNSYKKEAQKKEPDYANKDDFSFG